LRLTIGSYTLDGTPASSTTTTAALRLPFDLPFAPRIAGNELRLAGLRVFVVAASESALKTDVDAILAQFDNANGKTVTFFNTTGTALFAIDSADWPEVHIEHEVDFGDDNAEIVFDIVATRPEPVSTGAADEAGQRGEIEWELEIGPNGLTGAVAIGEFGPVGAGTSAWENAAAWVAGLFGEPPTGIPTFFSDRLRAVQARPVSRQKPNQASITDESYDPVTVMVMFREVYTGLGTIPADITDVNVNVSVANSEAMDVRAGEASGPAIVVLSGWFFIKTEAPTEFLSAATAVSNPLQRGQTVYSSIEADFRNIYASLSLHDLGAVELDISPDSGRCTFRRSFSTTRVLVWRESTRVNNVDPVVINRDYKGKDIVHHGRGGPVATLSHSLYIESMDVVPYTPPTLDSNWIRMDRGQDVTIEARLRGERIIFTTNGSSNWRYANPSERGPSDQGTTGQGKVLTLDNIGNGTL
jgi:hypothetical protein